MAADKGGRKNCSYKTRPSSWGELINNALKTNTIKYLVTFQAFNAFHLNCVS